MFNNLAGEPLAPVTEPERFPPIPPSRFAQPLAPHNYSPALDEYSVQSALNDISAFAVETGTSGKLNITEIKIFLGSCNELLTSLERIMNYLQVTKKSLSDEDWNLKVVEAEQKKEDLANLFKSLADPLFVREVVVTVKRQRRKRQWREKKTMLWREKKNHDKLSREKEHRRIDLWLENMKDEVERARRAESIKKEGDLVLANVTQNKSSAKRYLNILNNLVKLRSARVQQAIAAGKTVSVEENDTFIKVVDKLKKMWMDQMKEYNLEEMGLRVLLDDAHTERVNVEDKLRKQTFQEWLEFFFGRDKKSVGEPSTLDQFTATRSAWDKFVVETNDENVYDATSIPIGWVVPTEPSDAHWARFNTYS